jgi:TolA-binding protein
MLCIIVFVALILTLGIILKNYYERPTNHANGQSSSKNPTKYEKKTIPLLQEQIEKKDKEIKEKDDTIEKLNSKIKDLNKNIEDLKREKQSLLDRNNNQSNDDNKGGANPLGQTINTRSINKSYIYLTVLDGPLVEAGPEYAVYYRAWKEHGKLMFEFVNSDRTKRAINNRTSIIDPFCEKIESSNSPDESEKVISLKPGILNEDFSVNTKVKIEYK